MQAVLVMAVLGYLFGRLSARAGWLRLPAAVRRFVPYELFVVAKGGLPVVLANLENPTPMVMAVTAMAATLANMYSRDAGKSAWVAVGSVLPTGLGWIWLSVLAAGALASVKDRRLADVGPALFAIGAAPTLFRITNRDIYFIWGIVLGAAVLREVTQREWASGSRVVRYLRATVVGLLFLCLGLSSFYMVRYQYRNLGLHVQRIARGPSGMKVVALTFDDGPDPKYTPAILEILAQFDVKATFFLVGLHVEKYPDLARRVVTAGHSVGSHTYTHRNLLGLSRPAIEAEVTHAGTVIERTTGQRVTLFRPPRGLYDANLPAILNRKGLTLALWSRSSVDWAEPGWEAVARRVLSKIKNGDIILLHDSGDLVGSSGGSRLSTVEALPTIVSELKRRGYSFVSLREMIFLNELVGGK
jgi:peptidoglycan/xylan/chitin deacetylase (PgdA/CDA1 family)